jgi:hypothetical protein
MELTLKNVKVHADMSEETTCFSASVYIDGKRAGTAKNRGHGGPTTVNWTDRGLGEEYEKWARNQVILTEDPADPEKSMIVDDWFKLEWKIGEALDAYLDMQWLKRQCKTRTLFRRTDQEDVDAWWVIEAPFCELAKKKLQQMYGDNLGEIANERFQ